MTKTCHQKLVRGSPTLRLWGAKHSTGSLDTTIRLKYTLTAHPTLTTAASLSGLLSTFGQTDAETIRILLKPPKKAPEKPAKFATAIAEFKQIGDAFAAVCASGREDRGLQGIQVYWAEGKEPQIIEWLKKRGVLGEAVSQGGQRSPPMPVKAEAASRAALSGLDYESFTIMRLRQAEREKLEREIREREGP